MTPFGFESEAKREFFMITKDLALVDSKELYALEEGVIPDFAEILEEFEEEFLVMFEVNSAMRLNNKGAVRRATGDAS